MRSSMGLGYTPRATMSRTRGAMTARSRVVISAKVALPPVGLAVEHPLVGPQQVDGGQDHPDGAHHRPPAVGDERAEEDEELPHEAVEPGQADRREHDHGEDGREQRRRLLDAAHVGDETGVAALVDHPHQEEEGAGGDAVVDHLQHAALQSLLGQAERCRPR